MSCRAASSCSSADAQARTADQSDATSRSNQSSTWYWLKLRVQLTAG